jgi:hypothetical protein
MTEEAAMEMVLAAEAQDRTAEEMADAATRQALQLLREDEVAKADHAAAAATEREAAATFAASMRHEAAPNVRREEAARAEHETAEFAALLRREVVAELEKAAAACQDGVAMVAAVALRAAMIITAATTE